MLTSRFHDFLKTLKSPHPASRSRSRNRFRKGRFETAAVSTERLEPKTLLTDLTFSYQLVDSSSQPIGSGDVLGPGDEFTLLVSAREDVAATPGGIGSLILDIDFDESLVEPVGYSSSVIDTGTWRTDFTQTSVGNTGGNLFLDNLGAGEPVSSLGKPGDGVDVLFASIPFRVKSDINAPTTTSATFTGLAYTSLGSSGGLIVNSLNAGSIASTDFGSASLSVSEPQTTNISIAPASAVKAEGNSGSTSFTFTVSRSGDTSAAGTVDYAVTGGGVNAQDFVGGTLPTGTVTFAANQTSKSVIIPVAGDTDFESDESFTVTLSNASDGASIATATASGTIQNDDAQPQADLEVKSFTVPSPLTVGSEASGRVVVENVGNATSSSYTIRVYISEDNTLDVNSDLLVLPEPLLRGPVGAGQTDTVIDFVNVPVDFTPGSYTVFVTIDDTVGSDTREVAAAPVEIVAPPTTTYSIAPDQAVKAEGNSGSTPFTFTVTRTGDSSAAGSVDYTVTGSGTNAANAADFTDGVFPSGTVNFAANQTSKTVTINVNGDTDVEPDEGFTVTLSNAIDGATITTATAIGTIQNEDALPAPSLSIAATDATKNEGNSGTTPFTFTVTRTGDTSAAGSVHYAVTGSGSNPANAADFTGGVFPNGTVNFGANDTSKTVTINVNGDTDAEPDEGFTVTLSNATAGGTIGAATANGTILNDNLAGPQQIVSFERNQYSATPGTTVSFDVTYDTSTADSTLSGLSFRLHFDSRELTWQSASNILNNGFDLATVSTPQADTQDLDGDDSTDSFVLFNFTDNDLQFPGQSLPATLATVSFTVSESFSSDTVLNFSESETALTDDQLSFYGFDATSAIVTPLTVNLDVDNDGRVRANTDGLTILRYLSGQRGDDLVRTIFLGGNRTDPEEIAAFLDQAVGNMLDVEDDGRSRANTDGLTILRYLSGQRGDDLVRTIFLGGGRTDPDDITTFLEGFDPSISAMTAARPVSQNPLTLTEIQVVANFQEAPLALGLGNEKLNELASSVSDKLIAQSAKHAVAAEPEVTGEPLDLSEKYDTLWHELTGQLTKGMDTLFDEL